MFIAEWLVVYSPKGANSDYLQKKLCVAFLHIPYMSVCLGRMKGTCPADVPKPALLQLAPEADLSASLTRGMKEHGRSDQLFPLSSILFLI